MMLKIQLQSRVKLAATLLAGIGSVFSGSATQAQVTFFPCSQPAATAAGATCQTLSSGGNNGPNPISIVTAAGAGGQLGNYTVTIDTLGNAAAGTVRGFQTMTQSAANSAYRAGLTNNGNDALGLNVTSTSTVLSGGSFTNPTQLTLNGTNATFGTATGAPITVTGVADGVNPFDAVNFRQLQAVSTGVASIAAMSNIPALDANKKFGIGIGYGNFQGNSALAVGVNGRLAPSLTAKLSVGAGLSYGATSVGTGVSYSW